MFINNHKKQIRLLCRVLFALYIAGLVYFLFFADMLDRVGIERSYHYNVIPFREIRRFIVYADLLGPVAVISNLFGNIAIFMPFGFLVPVSYTHLDVYKRQVWLREKRRRISKVPSEKCFDIWENIRSQSCLS